jgi:hypothetical protein
MKRWDGRCNPLFLGCVINEKEAIKLWYCLKPARCLLPGAILFLGFRAMISEKFASLCFNPQTIAPF